MKITAYHPALRSRGGAEALMVEQMRYLATAGHDVRLVLLDFDPLAWQDDLSGLAVHEVRSGLRERHFYRSQWKKIQSRSGRAAPYLHEADLVVAYNYPCSALLGYADVANTIWHCCEPARTLHLEAANPEMAEHCDRPRPDPPRWIEWYQYERDFHRRLGDYDDERERDRKAIARVDGIIAISAYSGQMVQRVFDRKVDRIVHPMVVFPAVSNRSGGLDGDGLHVLMHTRLHSHKNPDTVLRGFALHHARDLRATLDVVGEGPELPILIQLASDLGIADAVTFHGYLQQADLEAVYRRCEVFALLPMDEPFGMVFPEAAARGLILVGPDHGGPMEILDGGKLGKVVDAMNPEALADAFTDISSWSIGRVDQCRREADAACRVRYSREVIGPQLEAALVELAG